MTTADLRQPKWSATRAISSSFALPSTGGHFNCACQVPSAASCSDDVRAFGLTFT